MDELVESKFFSHRDLRKINNCRLYLQVFYLSDIVSGDGTKIMHHFANGYRTPARNSIWKWPRQSRPNESSWNLWKMAITNVWKKIHGHSYLLCLGDWLTESHQSFEYFFDPKHNVVLTKTSADSYSIYRLSHQRTRNVAIYSKSSDSTYARARWIPVMTEPIDRYSIAVEAGITSIKRSKPKKCNTLIDFIRTRYPHYDSLLQYATILDDGKCLIDAIAKPRIISVTDASVSVLNNTSAVSWTINKNVETPLAYGLASCPDYITTQDSYGAEMFGIFNILVVMQMVTKYHNINHGELIIACDNDASLLVGTDGLTKVKIDQKYFDLIWAIQDILNTLPITVIAQKVKGHTDK